MRHTSSSHSPYAAPAAFRQRTAIIATVLGLHMAGIWALQADGLTAAPAVKQEAVIAATIINTPSAPAIAEKPIKPVEKTLPAPVITPPAPNKPAPRPTPQRQTITPAAATPPTPLAVTPTLAPSSSVPAVAAAPTHPSPTTDTSASPPTSAASTNASAPTSTVAASASAATATAAAPKIDLPSSSAAYLNNPKPAYPSISKRMGEEGKVLLRVLVSADGVPQKVELKTSSGYERLDRQAIDAVQQWRFVPGKRNGVAEAMWNLVPVQFVLE